MAEANTCNQKTNQSKLLSQITLKPCPILIDNEKLVAFGYSVKHQTGQ